MAGSCRLLAPVRLIWRPGRDLSFVREDASSDARYSGCTSLVTYVPAHAHKPYIRNPKRVTSDARCCGCTSLVTYVPAHAHSERMNDCI